MILGRASPPYVGPGDIANTNFNFWAGLRAYSQATVGTKAIRLVRASDSTQMDINTLSDGTLDIATATTFCNGTTCSLVNLYDKTSGAHDITATGVAPTFIFNALNTSLPALQSLNSNANGGVTGASFTPPTTVVNFSTVVNRVTGAGNNNYYLWYVGSGFSRIRGSASANTVQMLGGASGNFTATMSDAAFHALNAVVNGVSSVIRVDSTETTGTTVGSVLGGPGSIGFQAATSTTMQQCEWGLSDGAAWDSTVRAAVAANQKAYWGTP